MTPQNNPKRYRPSSSDHLFDLLAMACLVLLFILNFFLTGGQNTVLDIIGFVLMALSLPFIYLPFFHLRRFGEVKKGDQYMRTNRLVVQGIYRIVRHPQYLGYIFLAAGFTFIGQHIIITLAGVISILLFIIHTFKEERIIRSKYARAYQDYAQKVPRFNFLLGLWRWWKASRQVGEDNPDIS